MTKSSYDLSYWYKATPTTTDYIRKTIFNPGSTSTTSGNVAGAYIFFSPKYCGQTGLWTATLYQMANSQTAASDTCDTTMLSRNIKEDGTSSTGYGASNDAFILQNTGTTASYSNTFKIDIKV